MEGLGITKDITLMPMSNNLLCKATPTASDSLAWAEVSGHQVMLLSSWVGLVYEISCHTTHHNSKIPNEQSESKLQDSPPRIT